MNTRGRLLLATSDTSGYNGREQAESVEQFIALKSMNAANPHIALQVIRTFTEALETLKGTGAKLTHPVGFSLGATSRTRRWSMVWNWDGTMLPHHTSMTSRKWTDLTMVKKNLSDPHTSHQKWVEGARYHMAPVVQATLNEWLDYAESQKLRVETIQFNQKRRVASEALAKVSKGIESLKTEISNTEKQIENWDDPKFVENWIVKQKESCRKRIENLTESLSGKEHTLLTAQKELAKVVSASVKV